MCAGIYLGGKQYCGNRFFIGWLILFFIDTYLWTHKTKFAKHVLYHRPPKSSSKTPCQPPTSMLSLCNSIRICCNIASTNITPPTHINNYYPSHTPMSAENILHLYIHSLLLGSLIFQLFCGWHTIGWRARKRQKRLAWKTLQNLSLVRPQPWKRKRSSWYAEKEVEKRMAIRVLVFSCRAESRWWSGIWMKKFLGRKIRERQRGRDIWIDR